MDAIMPTTFFDTAGCQSFLNLPHVGLSDGF